MMRLRYLNTLTLWLLSEFAASALATPTSVIQNSSQKRDTTCGFDGNSDLYGLGIRLGTYLQWTSGFLIYIFRLDTHRTLRETYYAFVIALTIAVIVITLQSEPVYAVEIFIITFIIFGGSYVVNTTAVERGPGPHNNPPSTRSTEDKFAGTIRRAAVIAMSIYCSWFWLTGVFTDFVATPCGTYGFFFGKISLFHRPLTNFFAALSIIYTILLAAGYLVLRRHPSALDSEDGRLGLANSVLGRFSHTSPGYTGERASFRIASKITQVIGAMALVYSVLGIELTIFWNSIRGVYTIGTTGQLIPFVIGVTNFAYTILQIWVRNYKKESAEGDGENYDGGAYGKEASGVPYAGKIDEEARGT